MASHELRTPLTSLRLLYQHLVRSAPQDRPFDLSPAQIERFLRTSERQFQRLGELIDRLLDVPKLAGGQLVLHLEEMDLAKAVREVAEQMVPQAQAAGSRLDLDLDASVVGHWDRVRVEQMITNLVANAIRYGLGQPVRVVLRHDPCTATFSVEDQGLGIAPADQGKLFQRFVRLAPDHHAGGLGLGLYICRTIVDAHRGAIRVDSAPGRGSTFTVELPRYPIGIDEGPAATLPARPAA
jgi:signal transduction histidine kinase